MVLKYVPLSFSFYYQTILKTNPSPPPSSPGTILLTANHPPALQPSGGSIGLLITCAPLCYRRCAGAHALSGKGMRAEATASALYPATAACQGGRVAASRVDSYEFRTADKHERMQILQPFYFCTYVEHGLGGGCAGGNHGGFVGAAGGGNGC